MGISTRQVVETLADDPRFMRLGKGIGRREFQMYIEDQQYLFANTSTHCLTADPSTYHGVDVMLGLLYSWEVGACANCVPTITPPGNILLDGEFALPDSLAARRHAHILHRRKALKDLRALSNLISHYTTKGIDQYLVPDGVHVWRLLVGERRVEVNSQIYIVTSGTAS